MKKPAAFTDQRVPGLELRPVRNGFEAYFADGEHVANISFPGDSQSLGARIFAEGYFAGVVSARKDF